MTKFKLHIGDNEVELEGETRDEAIKKVGLNPEHRQKNRGENMEIKKATDVNEQQSSGITCIDTLGTVCYIPRIAYKVSPTGWF
jgi:hypothetical protein